MATLVLGFAVGLLVGRWWAVVAAGAVGIWIALSTGVDEVPPWFLGFAYAVFAAVGIAAGVLVRRMTRRAPREG